MTHLPFQALVGIELAQQALLLLAVDPRLQGVVLAAAAGTGKSSLARGMRRLLGDEEVPFVEIPPGVDLENLLGGLDLEATLRSGEMVLQPGVLARAHGGIAYVDGINLIGEASANLLLSVIDDGEVRIEREGLSHRAPADFALIGSYDPAEGAPRRHLLDRVGLLAPLPAAHNARQRALVIRRNLFPSRNGRDEEAFLSGAVRAARELLPQVTISDEQVEQLCVTALQYGVEGHRADLFAVRAACASAALNMREEVEEEDLQLAARLVILPRATRVPTPPPEEDTAPPPPEGPADQQPPEPESGEQSDSEGDDQDDEQRAPPPPVGIQPEQILEALESELPQSLEELPFTTVRRGRTGSRGATLGNRGRHVRSIPGDPRRARIDVVATLRAAAPWQGLRNGEIRTNGNGKAPQQNGSGPPMGANGSSNGQNGARPRIRLQMSDIRVKQYQSKAGALFCFAVDASGSMALHRMRQAKGAVHALLEQAYVNRDRVALLAFRGDEAELLMPPTQSVELAQRALDLLPTGGGTPLASALLLGHDVADQARRRGIFQTVLVLLTDGRANVALHEDGAVEEELQRLGRTIAESAMQVIVVDTQRNYLSRGEARRLAEWLGAEYAYLPNASGEAIAELASGVAAGV